MPALQPRTRKRFPTANLFGYLTDSGEWHDGTFGRRIRGQATDRRLIEREGGYVHHLADRGGATCFGITEAVARAHGYGGVMRDLPRAGCAALLPSEWRAGVIPAPLPDGVTVGDWVAFADAQTGKLDEANGRTSDAIGIVERCEARDSAAVKRARRSWLGRLFD